MRSAPLLAGLLFAGAVAASGLSPADCWSMRKHGRVAETQTCFASLTRSNEPYFRAEGFWGLEQWEQANGQFRIAANSTREKALVKARWGRLLHERFNESEAVDLFREALAADPANAQAYVGLALVSASGFDGKTGDYLTKAAELDPKSAEPHELLANLALENDARAVASEEADKALALDPESLNAMAVRAAIELLDDHSPDPWLNRIRAINPNYGEGYALVARQLELHYRFEDAVAYYRKAVAASPRLWSAHSALGVDLMRLGEEDAPRRELELSYENGYRDKATVNSLRLLDSYKNFETVRSPSAVLRLHKSEVRLLQPYFESELQAITRTYTQKYRMTLSGPVQVEVYPNHEDFAVRTMGMPGLGALGVTFGKVIAMDSPSAHRPGDFNWGATLWHEMSHVYVLTATNSRVPRWFTEGLAVHEEGEHSPEWRDRLTPDVLVAIRDKKLLPVARLDQGFVSPQYPAQVLVSYFEAGSMCDFIAQKWGEAKLLDVVHSFGKLRTTPQAVEENLGLGSEDFDKQFLAWIDGRFGAEAEHFDTWREKLKTLFAAAQQKQYDAVLAQGPAVLALYPEYVDAANPYELMAQADQAKGDGKAEAAILTAYEHVGGQSPDVLKRLASLEEAGGQPAEAAATLERLIYIYPVHDEELHRHLGGLLLAQKQYDGAIREYSALVASHPTDLAGAEYFLAEAYLGANQKDKAEESVLAALETAPGYRPAQKLLLELEQPNANQK